SQHHPSCHAPWTSPNATICLPILLEAAVGHEVVEAARAELRAARDPLADEAGLLETSLLRNVLHVGLGLHAVEARLREQPLRELDVSQPDASGLWFGQGAYFTPVSWQPSRSPPGRGAPRPPHRGPRRRGFGPGWSQRPDGIRRVSRR